MRRTWTAPRLPRASCSHTTRRSGRSCTSRRRAPTLGASRRAAGQSVRAAASGPAAGPGRASCSLCRLPTPVGLHPATPSKRAAVYHVLRRASPAAARRRADQALAGATLADEVCSEADVRPARARSGTTLRAGTARRAAAAPRRPRRCWRAGGWWAPGRCAGSISPGLPSCAVRHMRMCGAGCSALSPAAGLGPPWALVTWVTVFPAQGWRWARHGRPGT